MIGTIHEHRIRVRDVQTGFDDHRRYEHVSLPVDELAHDLLEIALAHLAMANGYSRTWHEALHVIRDRVDRLHAVVNEEHLAAAVELARDSFLDQAVIPRLDEREHR